MLEQQSPDTEFAIHCLSNTALPEQLQAKHQFSRTYVETWSHGYPWGQGEWTDGESGRRWEWDTKPSLSILICTDVQLRRVHKEGETSPRKLRMLLGMEGVTLACCYPSQNLFIYQFPWDSASHCTSTTARSNLLSKFLSKLCSLVADLP
jgi:hypothetical protein